MKTILPGGACPLWVLRTSCEGVQPIYPDLVWRGNISTSPSCWTETDTLPLAEASLRRKNQRTVYLKPRTTERHRAVGRDGGRKGKKDTSAFVLRRKKEKRKKEKREEKNCCLSRQACTEPPASCQRSASHAANGGPGKRRAEWLAGAREAGDVLIES